MARTIDFEGCKLYGTTECNTLNMPSCDTCMLRENQEDCDRVKDDLLTLHELLPEGGVSELFESESCLLCKANKNKRSCFAMVDMAHAEPKRTKRNALGLKSKSLVGSLVPVQIACCTVCRRNLLLLEYLPLTIPAVVGLLSLLVLSFDAVNRPLIEAALYMPLIVFAFVVGACVVATHFVVKSIAKKFDSVTETDLLKVPTIVKMREKGWFPLNASKKGRISAVFMKNRLKCGVCTGGKDDAAPVTR